MNPRRTIQMIIKQETLVPVTEMDRNRSPAHKSENQQVGFYFLAYIRDIPHLTAGTCNTIRIPQWYNDVWEKVVQDAIWT